MHDDLWLQVLKLLSNRDAVSAGQTCRSMRSLVCSMARWQDTRARLGLHPVRPSARVRTTDFAVVLRGACAGCLSRRRAKRVPVCNACLVHRRPLLDMEKAVREHIGNIGRMRYGLHRHHFSMVAAQHTQDDAWLYRLKLSRCLLMHDLKTAERDVGAAKRDLRRYVQAGFLLTTAVS